MAEELGERTEQPTGRRRGEARGRGQIPKSPDLSSAVDLTGAVLLLMVFGATLFSGFRAMMERLLSPRGAGEALSVDSIPTTVLWVAGQTAWLLFPILFVLASVAYGGQFLQVGWLITAEPLKIKPERLNPVAGLKRLLNTRSLVKTAVNTLKLAVVAVVAVAIIRRDLDTILALPLLEPLVAAVVVADLMVELAIWLLALMLAIGIIDWLYQRWQHTQDLRMTRQEVKDERKSMEGDAEVKSRRLRMARDIIFQQIRQNVPKADVVVTNPTHFSVALKYDQATMRAPRLVAKGADHMAFRIRHVALASGVPIVERPPLARALFHGVEIGQEVPPEHYQAVAEILAYVYRMEGRAA